MKFSLPRPALQSNETEELSGSLRIVRSESPTSGRPLVKIWRGKAARPFAFYSFRDELRRETYVNEMKSNDEARIARLEARRQERREFKHTLAVGDIVYSTWGYDQTNADFYQVTEVLGKMVVVREVAAPLVAGEEGFMSGRRVARKDDFTGEPMRRIVTLGNGVKISETQFASKWDGRPVSVSWYA